MDTSRVSNNRARFGSTALVALTAFMVFALYNSQAIIDWFYFLRYRPSAEVKQLANEAGMSRQGKRLFYRTDPKIVSPEEISQKCDVHHLGCINEDGRVFILDYGNEVGYKSAVVTAAHEMLHFAYFRLDNGQKDQTEDLLRQQIDALGDRQLEEYLKKRGSRSGYFDEAHSILGTEYLELEPKLEAHYRRYFDNRQKVVEAFRQSKFEQIRN